MPKDDRVYLAHMLDMVRKAVTKTRGLTRSDYDQDENLRLALVHLIQVIGEAARHVSPESQRQHPAIPWANIVGMVHDYLDVDEDIIWAVVTSDLPPLLANLERIVPPEAL